MMEQFLKLPPAQKAGVLLAVLLVIGAGAYFVLIDPAVTTATLAEKDLKGAEAELNGLVAVTSDAELVKLREQKDAMVEADKENRKMLPSAAEVPDFIEQVQKDALANSLSVSRFDRLPTVSLNLIDAVPVRMTVTGSLLDLVRFLRIYAGPSRRVIHLRTITIETVPPEMGALLAEYRKSLPPEQLNKDAQVSPAEKALETIEVLTLGRKKSVVRATFTAFAYTWTGTTPAEGEGQAPDSQLKRKRT